MRLVLEPTLVSPSGMTIMGLAKPLLAKLLIKDDAKMTISKVVRTLGAFRGLCSEPSKDSTMTKEYVADFLANSYEFVNGANVPAANVFNHMLDLVSDVGIPPKVDAEEFIRILEYLDVPMSASVDGTPMLDHIRPIISTNISNSTLTLPKTNMQYFAGWNLGIDTQGQSLKNANFQLRSEFPNPRIQTGPWNNSTI